MKLTKKVLRENRIFNPHNLASVAGSKLYIDYTTTQYGRMPVFASWRVIGINCQTDPNGHWRNYGQKTFTVYHREEKQPQLEFAMQWVKENYGITEWERDVFGSYQIKGTLDKIKRMLGSNDNVKEAQNELETRKGMG